MNETLKKAAEYLKNPKILMIAGFAGIFLIFISSFFPLGKDKKDTAKNTESSISAEGYRKTLEESIQKIVSGITGDKNATVVVTLDSSIRYSYADSTKTDSSNSAGKDSEQTSESLTQSYITVKSADGGEQPLIITELMPKVRGVAVICRNGGDIYVAEQIEKAVTAALNITSNRVYISGGIE